ncbi:MAG: nucleotidyltransferase family protein [Burkholderiales bacterium]|jgi:predicted nucleotidyltransferase|nr:nucleotidyltransferase family protein [Burkholderiales bacterium]
MRPSTALAAKRDAVVEAVRRHAATKPRIVGSAARGLDHEGSDLDLLVDPAPTATLLDLGALQVEPEALLQVPVDLLTPGDLPDRMRSRVLADAVPV